MFAILQYLLSKEKLRGRAHGAAFVHGLMTEVESPDRLTLHALPKVLFISLMMSFHMSFICFRVLPLLNTLTIYKMKL